MTARVVAIGLNPALDQTVVVERLQPGAVHRATSSRTDAGGKAVNVASCLADWGAGADDAAGGAGGGIAIAGLLGADNAAPFARLFAAQRIDDHCLRVPGTTRTNIKLFDAASGDTTDINLPGFDAGPSELQAVVRTLGSLAQPGSLAVLSGSVPPGMPDAAYVDLLHAVAASGMRAVLDTSGAPLRAALQAPRAILPYAIKPNRHELEDWAGRPLPTEADLCQAAAALQAIGVALVIVSLGAQGALFVRDGLAVHAQPPAIAVTSSVGAGDAMVAGVVAALLTDADLDATARLATACAAAKLGMTGPHLPGRAEVERIAQAVQVTRVTTFDSRTTP